MAQRARSSSYGLARRSERERSPHLTSGESYERTGWQIDHHRMTADRPIVIFFHSWGTGPADKLAAGFEAAVSELGKHGTASRCPVWYHVTGDRVEETHYRATVHWRARVVRRKRARRIRDLLVRPARNRRALSTRIRSGEHGSQLGYPACGAPRDESTRADR
jgi:hypothetical protein